MMRAQFVATPGPIARFAAQGGRIIARTWERLWDWQARRATVSILHALDDRTLRDIGISRSEITSLVYGERSEARRAYDAAWRCFGGGRI